MTKIKLLKEHLLLALVFFSLTLGQQYLFYVIKSLPIIWFSLTKYLAIYLFFFVLTFAKGQKTRFFLLSFIMLINVLQIVHLSYFGTQIMPSEVYLVISQFGEVQGTLKEELDHILLGIGLTALPVGIGYYFLKRIRTAFEWSFITLLACAYLVYNPIRTYVTGNSWGRQPSSRELMGVNVYLSISYFFGRILPYKINGSKEDYKNLSTELKLVPNHKNEWDKVIIVLGESLSPHHLNLFGYERPTTPFLTKMKNEKNFHANLGLTSAVSTDISVAFFLNLTYGLAGAIKASKGEHCLFKLAKDNKFDTYYFSNQSEQQLRYIIPYLCPKSLDSHQFLEQLEPGIPDVNAASDLNLFRPLEKILTQNKRQMIMLHQRGSHAPWNLRSSPESKKFNDPENPRLSDYDNSVVEFDSFWQKLDTLLKKSSQKILVVYLSDHGEAVGENGRWGHGFLNRSVAEVPIIVTSYNRALPLSIKNWNRFIPQYHLGLFITQELGYNSNQNPGDLMSDYTILGNDIDGFAGSAKINLAPQGYDFILRP